MTIMGLWFEHLDTKVLIPTLVYSCTQTTFAKALSRGSFVKVSSEWQLLHVKISPLCPRSCNSLASIDNLKLFIKVSLLCSLLIFLWLKSISLKFPITIHGEWSIGFNLVSKFQVRCLLLVSSFPKKPVRSHLVWS